MSMSLSGSRGIAGSKIPRGYSAGRLQQMPNEGMDLLQSLYPYVSPGSELSRRAQGDESAFAPIEERANRDFQEFQGQMGSRFSEAAPGAMSSRGGSGFKNAANQASIDFASQLTQQRQGLQRQALGDLMGISNMLLGQHPYQNFLVQKKQKQPSFWSRLFGAAAPAVGAGIGGAFGGVQGAQMGASLGGAFSQGFNSF